jgi:uncharacterized protein (DUF924 family)
MPTPVEVLHFRFEETPPSAWFRPGPERDQARAFAGDGQDRALTRRPFWLMPLMPSEDLVLQERGLPLFERHTDLRTADFPHRNRVLGRPSIIEEMAFLQKPGSRF